MRPGALVMAALLIAIGAPWAQAASSTLVVDTSDDSFDGSCSDGDCSLRDAVKSAPRGHACWCRRGSTRSRSPVRGGVGEGTIELRRQIEIVGDGRDRRLHRRNHARARRPSRSCRGADAEVRTTIENLTVFGARDASLSGGALRVEGGRLHLVGVTIGGGLAERGGGIAVAAGARLRLVETLVIGNEAARPAAASGTPAWSPWSVPRSWAISRTTAAASGQTSGSATSIETATIAGNTATGEGGGLLLAGAAEIVASTIGENEAARGGGITVGDPVASGSGVDRRGQPGRPRPSMRR